MTTTSSTIVDTGRSEEIAAADASLRVIERERRRADQAEAMLRTTLAALDTAELDIEVLLDDAWTTSQLIGRLDFFLASFSAQPEQAQRVTALLLRQQIGRWRDG